LDVRHHIVEQRLDVSRIVERKDVGMLQPSEQADFPNESELTCLGCRIGVEDFDGDLSFVLEVASQVHCSKCALTELPLEVVVSAESGTKCSDRIERRSQR
jgi:hypothetical protein